MNKKLYYIPYFVILAIMFCGPDLIRGQKSERTSVDTLALPEAMRMAIKANHGIRIARNTAEMETNKATIGNAGYLPRLDLIGSAERSVMDKRVEFANNNPPREKEGAISTRYNSSLVLTYTLFDGFGNRYRLKELKSSARLASAESRQKIENTLVDVITGYLRVIGQRRNAKISQDALQLSVERYRRAKKRYETGGSSQVDLLNARVALNQDSVRYIQARADLREAKRKLLVLMGQNPTRTVTVENDFSIDRSLSLSRLQRNTKNENASLSAARLEKRQAKWNLKQVRANQYPTLNLETSYSYSHSEDEVSIQTFQRSDGLRAGLSLRFNIFNGFRRSIEKQNARLRLDNMRERLNQTRKELRRAVLNTYQQYETNLILLEKQHLDVETADLNFQRTRKAYRLGQVSNSDFREAQLNLLRARRRLIELKINAKLSEIRLFQLSGQLVGQVRDK